VSGPGEVARGPLSIVVLQVQQATFRGGGAAYTSSSGIVSGNSDTLVGNAAIESGVGNTVIGLGSFVSGDAVSGSLAFATGLGNTASGPLSFVDESEFVTAGNSMCAYPLTTLFGSC